MIHAASELIHACIMSSNNFAQLLGRVLLFYKHTIRRTPLHVTVPVGSGYISSPLGLGGFVASLNQLT